MKTNYRLLLISFIVSLLAGVLLIIHYASAIISLISNIEYAANRAQAATPPNPEEIFRVFFNPALLLSGAIAFIASITNRIAGIILIAGNKTMKEGERVLWILGFILINVVTNIVFLALKSARNLVPAATEPNQSSLY